MTWEDIEDMPHGELDEYIAQSRQWAAVQSGAELKE